MPWIYLIIISLLVSFIFYTLDQVSKMAHDVKYIRMKVDKVVPTTANVSPTHLPSQTAPSTASLSIPSATPSTASLSAAAHLANQAASASASASTKVPSAKI